MSHEKVAEHLLDANRKATLSLIKVAGKPVQIIRHDMQSDGQGGMVVGGESTLAAVRRYFSPVMQDDRPVMTTIGETVFQQYVLVGPHGDDIRSDDHILVDGKRYEIDWVDSNKEYQTKAFINVRVGG